MKARSCLCSVSRGPGSRSSLGRSLALAVALPAIILVFACRRPAPQPDLIRLIDVLGRENVVDSPLLDLASNPGALARTSPNVAATADKFPLLDLESGPNPLLLKKKMAMGPYQENALFAPPRSLFRFRVTIPERSVLEFSSGIYWGGDKARKAKGRASVSFLVRARSSGREDVLFQRTLTLESKRNLVQVPKRIDLSPLAGKTVDLEFVTHGDPDSLALWFNPVIFRTRPDPVNVILISIDTLRADHLSCYGYRRPTSPSLDRLVSDSVLFQNTYATSPWTLPSHVSILSGLDTVSHQVTSSANRMDPAIPTLADFLRRAGFVTAAFTGGGFVNGVFGMNKGFDFFLGRSALSSPRQAETLARLAVPWIKDHAGRRFFLFLHTYQVHNPYNPPESFARMFLDPDATVDAIDMAPYNHQNRFRPPESEKLLRNIVSLYDSEIRYTDEALFGRLTEELKRLGLYDRTMIIITADHGEEFYEKKSWLHTQDVYDPVLKVPLVIKFPRSRGAGTKVSRLVRITDIMPTILEEFGIDFRGTKLDGRDLGPFLEGKESGPERVFRSELAANVVKNHLPRRRAISQGRLKVIVNDPYSPDQQAYFVFPPPIPDRIEIYDLAADPGELKNLAQSRPDLARKLLSYLEDNFKVTRKALRRGDEDAEMTEELKEELKALGYIR